MRADKRRNLTINMMVERSVYWAVRDLARDYDMSTSAMARFLIIAAYEEIAGKGWAGTATSLYKMLGMCDAASEFQVAVDKAADKGADSQVPWE